MDKDYIIKLTLAVYQMSEWWPETNLLKFQLRNLANEILTGFISMAYHNPGSDMQVWLFKNIQAFQQSLSEVRAQKLINRREFLLFRKEYGRVGGEIKGLVGLKRTKSLKKEKDSVKESIFKQELNQRQEKILKILRKKPRIQVWEFKGFFPDISKRTLRRDLEDLLKKELVERKGEWNKIFYNLSIKG